MKRSERGVTLLEVVILMAVSVILIFPGYSYISGIYRVRAEHSERRKLANRTYELVEMVKRSDTEELLEGAEYREQGIMGKAWAEYDREFDEARERRKRSGGMALPHRKLNIYIEVYEGENLSGEYSLIRVEGDSIED